MTEKRLSYFHISPLRIILSLVMAFTMFLHSGFSSSANVVTGTYSYTVYNSAAYVPLSASVYLPDNPAFPIAFSGTHEYLFDVSNSAGKRYSSGLLVIPVTFNFISTDPGEVTLFSPGASVSHISAPDGVNVVLLLSGGTNNSLTGSLNINFDNTDFTSFTHIGVTFDLFVSASVNIDKMDTIAPYARCNASFGTASTHSASFYDAPQEFQPFENMVYFYMDRIAERIAIYGQGTISKLQELLENMASYFLTVIARINFQIENDNSNTTKVINALNSNSSSEINNAKQNSQNEITAANTNSSNEINAANNNSKNEIDTANKNADDIMHSYDSASQEGDNAKFDASQKELQETEDNLFASASDYFSGLDFSDYDLNSLPGVISSISFVSGFLQSLYVKSGVFGIIVTVCLVIMVASKVIGLYRFSTGGDS